MQWFNPAWKKQKPGGLYTFYQKLNELSLSTNTLRHNSVFNNKISKRLSDKYPLFFGFCS
jgi:hypothetical protein